MPSTFVCPSCRRTNHMPESAPVCGKGRCGRCGAKFNFQGNAPADDDVVPPEFVELAEDAPQPAKRWPWLAVLVVGMVLVCTVLAGSGAAALFWLYSEALTLDADKKEGDPPAAPAIPVVWLEELNIRPGLIRVGYAGPLSKKLELPRGGEVYLYKIKQIVGPNEALVGRDEWRIYGARTDRVMEFAVVIEMPTAGLVDGMVLAANGFYHVTRTTKVGDATFFVLRPITKQ